MRSKIFSAVLAAGFIAFLSTPVLSQEDDASLSNVQEVAGEVVSVNAEDTSIVITYPMDEASQTMETADFDVTDETRIMENENLISLSELESGDEVTLMYVTDEMGKNVARLIWLEDSPIEAPAENQI